MIASATRHTSYIRLAATFAAAAMLLLCAFSAAAGAAGAAVKRNITVTGTYAIPVEDSFAKGAHGGGKAAPVLDTKQRTYKLRLSAKHTRVFKGKRSYRWRYGKKFIGHNAQVVVKGTLRGNTLSARTISFAKPSKRSRAATYSGAFRTAVILYNFSNDTSQPYTSAQLQSDVFTGADSANAYWKEISHNTISFTGAQTTNASGDMFGWVTIPNTNANCDYQNWGNAALTAAGVNAANYDRVIFVSPTPASCNNLGGVAMLGSNKSWFFQGQLGAPNPRVRVIAHELGHNFGLMHTGVSPCPVSGNTAYMTTLNSSTCYDQSAFGGWGTGNPVSLMGYGANDPYHISTYQKIYLGSQPVSSVTTMSGANTYPLAPASPTLTLGTQMLQIARPNDTSHFGAKTLYAEFRQPYGAFDTFAPTDKWVNGVIFSVAPALPATLAIESTSSNGWQQQILDGDPGTPGIADPVALGHSFYDDGSAGVYTVSSVGSGGATVERSTPPAAGNYPTVSITGGKLVYSAGTGQHNSVYATQDGANEVITDNAAPITAGSGCTTVGPQTVSCPTAGLSEFDVNLGDQGDSFDMTNQSDIYPVVVDGGTGTDYITGAYLTISYATRTNPVNVSFDGVANDGEAGENDSIGTGLAGVIGGSGNDTLTGSDDPYTSETFDGGLGNDVIDGRGGDTDLVTYATRTQPIVATINGQATSGQTSINEHDTLLNVESITGGSADDILTGQSSSAGYGVLSGGDGNDTLVAGGPHWTQFQGGAGNDTMIGNINTDNAYGGAGDDVIDTGRGGAPDYVDGGSGEDTVTYATRTFGVPADVVNGAYVSANENDSFSSIEDLIGSPQADTLTGDVNANKLDGGAGNDTITGGAGNDTITGGAGTDTLDGGAGNDSLKARDGEVDSVTCGADTDTAKVDSIDTPVNGCETVSMQPSATIDTGIADGGSSTNTTQAFTFSSDTAPVTFECSPDGATFATCTSPYTMSSLSLGTHTFAVRARDLFGGVTSPPTTRTFTIISAAPDTVFDAGPANGATIDEANPTYAFHGVPSATSYECQIDTAGWSACTSPRTFTPLSVGAHTISARAIGAGGADPTPAVRTVTVAFPTLVNKPAPASTPSTVNLTTDSTFGASLDWIHFKNASPATVDRKNATQQISTFSLLPGSSAATRSDSPNYTWTDAVGTASGSSKVGVATGTNGHGFKLTVPAVNTQTRTLKLFVGVVGYGATGKLSVYFNGQTPVTDTTVTGGFFSTTTRVFTITYRPTAASDTLNVEWSQSSGSSSNRVVLYSAALYNAPEPDTTITTTTPAEGATITASTASFAFTSTLASSTFQCRMDAGTWASCTSSWTTPTLTTGLHTVRVRAISPNGNIDKTSAVRDFYKG